MKKIIIISAIAITIVGVGAMYHPSDKVHIDPQYVIQEESKTNDKREHSFILSDDETYSFICGEEDADELQSFLNDVLAGEAEELL